MPPYRMHAMLSSSVHWYQVSLPEIWRIIRIESGKKKYWGKKKRSQQFTSDYLTMTWTAKEKKSS